MSNRQFLWEPVIQDTIKDELNKLDISRLQEGMSVKNYSEMCNLLQEEQKTGSSKMHQIKEWQRYFEWDQVGHKYNITKIYKKPLPKIVSDKATYAKFMQLILMRVLLNCDSGTYYFFPNIFYELSGMVDTEFRKLITAYGQDQNTIESNELQILKSRYGIIDDDDLNDFTTIIKKKLAEITASALSALERSALIHYTKEYAVKTTPWNQKGGFRTATKEEEVMIVNAEQNAMNELDLSNKYVGYSLYGDKFRGKVNEYLHKNKETLYGSVRRIRISYSKPSKEYFDKVTNNVVISLLKDQYIDDKMKDDDFMIVEFAKIALNDLVIDALVSQAKNIHNKALYGQQKDDRRILERSSTHYISNFIYTVDNAIRLKTNSRVLDYEEDSDN